MNVLIAGGGPAALEGAVSFRGPEDAARLRAAFDRLYAGERLRVAFVAVREPPWTLPLYELALLTARVAGERGLALEPWLVTWEQRPPSLAMAARCDAAGVRLWCGADAVAVEDGRVWFSLEGSLPVDLAVALPRSLGPCVAGVPADLETA
jgi:hypothetical protein